MKINTTLRTAAAALLLTVASVPVDASSPQAASAQETAAELARLLMTGGELPQDHLTPQMQAAFGADRQAQVRTMLTTQNGAVQEVGDAWLDDEIQGYQRYRVPVTFEKATLDLQIAVDGAGRIAGLFVQAHVEPRVSSADAAEKKAAAASEEAKAPGPEIEIRLGEGEGALPGLLALPGADHGDGPFAAVVLVHGSGPNDRDETVGAHKVFRDVAWGLAQRGVASLRYDKRSLVRPQDLAALGEELTADAVVVDDARAALALLRERPEVDAGRVFVLGHSLGGTLAPRIARAEPRPAGIVALAGSTLPLPEKVLEQTRYIVGLDGEVSPEEQAKVDEIAAAVRELRAALDGGEPPAENLLGAPLSFFRDLESDDPPVTAAEIGLPIFVVQGERDYQVTMDDFARWREHLDGKPGACLRAYPGLDHLFRHGEGKSTPASYHEPGPFAAEVLDDVAAWILEGRCPE